MPLFSVIVATRNRPETLARTLRAIARQTLPDVETIVVDDGSTAGVRSVVAALVAGLGARFRLAELGEPGHEGSGVAHARNFGIDRAHGDFLAFCDDDDEWVRDDHLAVAADALRTHPDAALYFANQAALRAGRVERDDWFPELTAVVAGTGVLRIEQADLIRATSWPHSNILIVKRTFAESVGRYWVDVRYEEDMDFYWRCLDRVQYALYRPQVVSHHHIPDRAEKTSVTSAMPELRQLQFRLRVTRHVAESVATPLLRGRARRLEAETLRSIALIEARAGRHRDAWRTGRDGLRARFTWKWALYVAWLAARAAFVRE